MRSRRTEHNPEGLVLFDSHVHLTDNQFMGEVKTVVKQAQHYGVREMLVASQNVPDSKEAVAVCRNLDGLYAAVGVHPHEAESFRSVDMISLKELCIEPQVKAIGEIGLDFFRTISSRSTQEVAFEVQIELAKTMDLPMVLHLRDATGRFKPIVEEHGYFSGVLHCFSGDQKLAEWAVEKGFFVSFAGNLTYPDSRLAPLIPAIPKDRLMVETDSPYLAPIPERGKRNEPAYLGFVLARMAEALGLTPKETAQLTRENARRCFRITS